MRERFVIRFILKGNGTKRVENDEEELSRMRRGRKRRRRKRRRSRR